MPSRLSTLLRAALVSLPVLALAAPPSAAAGGNGASGPLLATINLGAGYRAVASGAHAASCAVVAAGAPGYRCVQRLWTLEPSALPRSFKDRALVAYELVAETPSAAAAQALESSMNTTPWKEAPYRRVYAVTWRTSFRVAPGPQRSHYTDWWWFSRGNDFVLLVFVVVPNAVTMAFDQAIRDQAAVAVDQAVWRQGLPAPQPAAGGAPLLAAFDLDGRYAAVSGGRPLARCAVVTGATTGYACTEGVWRLEAADVAADSLTQPVAIYELVVRAPTAAAAQALNDAIARGGGKPWMMAAYRPVNAAMWQVADQADPGLSGDRLAIGDWWQAVRGDNFMVLECMIHQSAASEAFDQTVSDQAAAILSEQALVSLTGSASGRP